MTEPKSLNGGSTLDQLHLCYDGPVPARLLRRDGAASRAAATMAGQSRRALADRRRMLRIALLAGDAGLERLSSDLEWARAAALSRRGIG